MSGMYPEGGMPQLPDAFTPAPAATTERGWGARAFTTFGLLAVGGGAVGLVYAANADATPGKPHKVTICHRTDSVTNPYVLETVDVASVDGNTGNDHGQGDHLAEHTGKPATSEQVAQEMKDEGVKWGDIIPSRYSDGTPDGLPSLNWPEGEAVFDNNCNYPTETSSSSSPSPSGSTSTSESPSPSGSTSTSASPSPSGSTSTSTSPSPSGSSSSETTSSVPTPPISTAITESFPPSTSSSTSPVPQVSTSFEGPGTGQGPRTESLITSIALTGLGASSILVAAGMRRRTGAHVNPPAPEIAA